MAAIAAVATAGAFAQGNVYSVNAVGYVNKTVAPGFNLIANPLNSGNNDINAVIQNVPEGFTVFTYSGGSYASTTFEDDGEGNLAWSVPRTIAPGQGFFINNNRSTNVTVTFVGEVPQGTLTNPLAAGFNLKASIVPQAGRLDTVLGFPAQEGDTVFVYNKPTESFRSTVFEDDGEGNLGWSVPDLAVIDVAQGFFVVPVAGAKNWTRNFSATN
jgi:hypothetical protein